MKSIAINGLGRIGFHMARVGWAFGMKVIANDSRPNPPLREKFAVAFMSLEEVLRQADVISLHLPYNPCTPHLINADRLRLLKPRAFLVNTSHGKLVDTEALAIALYEERLGGSPRANSDYRC